MFRALRTLIEQLGWPGQLALALLLGAAALFELGVGPLEIQNRRLNNAIERTARQARPGDGDPNLIRTASPPAKLAAFYQFFRREEAGTDWLAMLYAIGQTVGVEMRAADYRLVKGPSRLERYEIALPLSGDYAKIQAFLENAMIEIPVLSLDQASFRRKRVNDIVVEADVRMTLHLLRP